MLLSILPSHKIDPKRLIIPRFQLDDFRDVHESIGNAAFTTALKAFIQAWKPTR